eukprot:750480-Hanusia_phi.AAC.11
MQIWTSHPKWKFCQPRWLSRDEIVAVINSNPDSNEILNIAPSEKRELLYPSGKERVLSRKAKDDLKRLIDILGVYDDSFWTRGSANLCAYCVNMDPAYLESKQLYTATDNAVWSQYEQDKLRLILETGNELTRYEMEALFIERLMPKAARREIKESLLGANDLTSFHALTRSEARDLVEESERLTESLFVKFGTRRHISDFPNSLGALGIQEFNLHGDDENYELAYRLESDDDLTDISMRQVMKSRRSRRRWRHRNSKFQGRLKHIQAITNDVKAVRISTSLVFR